MIKVITMKKLLLVIGALCCLYYQYPLHWDVVGFGGDVEVELFAEANAYGEEVAVF